MAQAPSKNLSSLGGLGKLTEVRQRLFFVLMAIVVFRVGSYISIPGLDPEALAKMFDDQKNTILGMFNMFSGGALERLSVFALNVMPYISASIIMQLLSATVPSLEQMKKEGDAGRRKITQYTRYLTVVLALFQGVGICVALQNQGVAQQGIGFIIVGAATLLAGTTFLMWLGEQVTERGIGNGISIIIFAGIVAGLPSAIAGTLELARTGTLNEAVVILLFLLVIAVIGFVIFVERGQRRITVNYAKRQQGRRVYAAQSSHLPLKLNMAGVIPPIFASSLIMFPATIGQWFGNTEGLGFMSTFAAMMAPGQPLFILFYGAGIMFFCFFYTALVFNAKETADNLKRSGAFIPGIRPGEQTARYIDGVMSRLTLWGALYITGVCLMPEFLRAAVPSIPFYFGGTSLLIIVVVVMDFMAQIQAHLISHQYEPLMRKANIKGQGGPGMLR